MTDPDRSPRRERRDPAQAAVRRRLDEVVALRTTQLALAKDAAEAALAAKSAFLARMSHEIRTPMNTIIGFSQIMLRDVDDPQLRRQVTKVLGAAGQLLELIDGILGTSRSEAGRARSMLEAASSPPLARGTGTRLLVVDDNELNLEVAAAQLKVLGYETDLARDGLEAIEQARRCDYAAILIDVQMPRMDGLDATRRLRQMAGHALTPVIAMTASVLEEDRRACLEAGMNDVISKPVDPRNLAQSLERWAPHATSKLAGTDDGAAPSAAGPGDQGHLRARLLELQRLLTADDLDAREYFHSLPAVATGNLRSELARAIDGFDYAQAGMLVARLLDGTGATGDET